MRLNHLKLREKYIYTISIQFFFSYSCLDDVSEMGMKVIFKHFFLSGFPPMNRKMNILSWNDTCVAAAKFSIESSLENANLRRLSKYPFENRDSSLLLILFKS